jgi:hypothetical protein
MERSRIYVETSVLGGCFDPEFRYWTHGLIEDFRKGTFQPVMSDIVASEVLELHESIRGIHRELLALGAQEVGVTLAALDLRRAYQERVTLAPNFQNDLLHLAVASLADVDVTVSWGLPRVISLDQLIALNTINQELGHRPVALSLPREVTRHGHAR